MKYKLRGDYVFYTKKEPLRNKLDSDGKAIGNVIIDDSVHCVDGQIHKLEPVQDKKNDPKQSKQSDIKQAKPESALPETAIQSTCINNKEGR